MSNPKEQYEYCYICKEQKRVITFAGDPVDPSSTYAELEGTTYMYTRLECEHILGSKPKPDSVFIEQANEIAKQRLTLKWRHSAQHENTIAYVAWGSGFLVRIEYNLKQNYWDVQLLNRAKDAVVEVSLTSMDLAKGEAESLLKEELERINKLFTS